MSQFKFKKDDEGKQKVTTVMPSELEDSYTIDTRLVRGRAWIISELGERSVVFVTQSAATKVTDSHCIVIWSRSSVGPLTQGMSVGSRIKSDAFGDMIDKLFESAGAKVVIEASDINKHYYTIEVN